MKVKLTLRMDEDLVQKAKRLSRKSGKSLSQMVADYFAAMDTDPEETDLELTPRVKSLYGILAGSNVEEKDYRAHLEEKHSHRRSS